MSAYPLINFEIQQYYQNQLRFNGVYSKDNLPNQIRKRAYIINLAEYLDIYYTSLFSPQDFLKNDSIILSYFKDA